MANTQKRGIMLMSATAMKL